MIKQINKNKYQALSGELDLKVKKYECEIGRRQQQHHVGAYLLVKE